MPHGGVSPASTFPVAWLPGTGTAGQLLGRLSLSRRESSPGFADHRSLKGLPALKSTDCYLIVNASVRYPWRIHRVCCSYRPVQSSTGGGLSYTHLHDKYLRWHSPCLARVLITFIIFPSLHPHTDTPTECQESWLPSRTPRE